MSSNKQPNSHYCFVCGIKNNHGLRITFFDNGVDQVWCEYTIPDHYQGYPGVAHGGVVAAILDEICGRTAMISDPDHFMMTAKIEVRYRIPVPVGRLLRIMGQMTRCRGRLAQARGEMYLPSGELAAEALVTLADIPDQFRVDGVLEDLSWKVYE